MKGDVYYGKGIRELEDEYPDLYDVVSNINETVWNGSAIEVLGITKEEIVDVLRVVLLTSGMPAFSKSLQILNSVTEAIEEEREDKA